MAAEGSSLHAWLDDTNGICVGCLPDSAKHHNNENLVLAMQTGLPKRQLQMLRMALLTSSCWLAHLQSSKCGKTHRCLMLHARPDAIHEHAHHRCLARWLHNGIVNPTLRLARLTCCCCALASLRCCCLAVLFCCCFRALTFARICSLLGLQSRADWYALRA